MNWRTFCIIRSLSAAGRALCQLRSIHHGRSQLVPAADHFALPRTARLQLCLLKQVVGAFGRCS